MREDQVVQYGLKKVEVPHRDPELAKHGFTEEKYACPSMFK